MSKQNVEDIYPLSASQQGMLFHLLFSGGEPLLRQDLSELVACAQCMDPQKAPLGLY